MSQWRLAGAGRLYPQALAPDIDAAIEHGRLAAVEELEQLLALMRVPGFHLLLLRPVPPPRRRLGRSIPGAS